jgi:hypothetical protein
MRCCNYLVSAEVARQKTLLPHNAEAEAERQKMVLVCAKPATPKHEHGRAFVCADSWRRENRISAKLTRRERRNQANALRAGISQSRPRRCQAVLGVCRRPGGQRSFMAIVTAHPRARHDNLATMETDLSLVLPQRWPTPASATIAACRRVTARLRKAFARWLRTRPSGRSAQRNCPRALNCETRRNDLPISPFSEGAPPWQLRDQPRCLATGHPMSATHGPCAR